jgi:hypothetical protein
MVDQHRRGEQDQVVIHPHVEEVQAPKLDMGAQSEANTTIGHPKPDKADRNAQKALPGVPIVCVYRTGYLNGATSEFVSERLDPDGVQSGHKDIYWFGHERPYVQWVLLRFVLPCTGVLVVGVTRFRERKHIPSLLIGGGGGGCYFD